MNARRFVIGDIHGCVLTFRRLLHEIIRIRKGDSVYLLGDTIDRGPSSKEVIDEIRARRASGHEIHSIRGNHEEMMLKSCRDRSIFQLWMANGGRETLRSFGVEDGCEIPSEYLSFVDSFPHFLELDEFILVHGGLNFSIAHPLMDLEAMLWSRGKEVLKDRVGGRRLVSGHTPLDREGIRRSLASDHIILDNGCIYHGQPGLGSLCALELNSMSLFFQENVDL